ncbi:MAG: 2-iminoacetate synthase ThiH [Kiritimatiellaeota bacterium]|nr:2-iminoacetate synthase ThiH [Kiritimatiellota bacterium]
MTNDQEHVTPDWLDVEPLLEVARQATSADVETVLGVARVGPREFAVLLSSAAASYLENMAHAAQALTHRHFGRTITLYAPLYLSNFCSSGCAYCGFAADRKHPRQKLSFDEADSELAALKRMGIEEVLLLTGERTPQADFAYVCECVRRAAAHCAMVTVETFPMTTAEYRELAAAGCTGITLYQETYDAAAYAPLHRWGPKRDFAARLEAPARALSAGLRQCGFGVLLGLADPIADALRLYAHVTGLQKQFWRAGFAVSFPRLRPEAGGFRTDHPVSDALLAQLIFAFRLALSENQLVLSTREPAHLRDGFAGIGISKMSVASRTTVGGYDHAAVGGVGQFAVNDARNIADFCTALRVADLEPVFKNWDATYR